MATTFCFGRHGTDEYLRRQERDNTDLVKSFKNKLYMMKLLIITILILLLNSCERNWETWYSIKIQNNSDKKVLVVTGITRFGLYSYPDTLLPERKPYLDIIDVHSYFKITNSQDWDKVIEKLPQKKLSIYFFNADTIARYDWSEIRKGYKVEKRVDLTLEDLQKSNYTINYP